MREYLFHAREWITEKWVEGLLTIDDFMTSNGIERAYCIKEIPSEKGGKFGWVRVVPESVGQYTGMNEFVVSDKSFNKPLFEGDIVEVWSRRRPTTENIELFRDKPTSQYDVEVKARAVICFKYGRWFLDYDNEYNKALCKLRGNEQAERTVNASSELDRFQYRGNNEEWYRKHNHRFKWHDIVKIGTVFENADLLEGK